MGSVRLILASSSPYRRELLRRLRIPFEAADPEFEEIPPPPEPASTADVQSVVLDNARGKARSLRGRFPGSLILGSDQLGECEGRVLSKPGTRERAMEQLGFLSGREHRLHGGIILLDDASGRERAEVTVSTMRMRELSPQQIRRYVDLDDPVHSAGSYKSECLGVALFESMRGDDPTAIVGLSLAATCRLLLEAGVDVLGP